MNFQDAFREMSIHFEQCRVEPGIETIEEHDCLGGCIRGSDSRNGLHQGLPLY